MSPNIFNSIRRPRARAANVVVSLESPYSGGDSVADCDAVDPAICFEFTLAGLANGTSSECAELNATITLQRTDLTSCSWVGTSGSFAVVLNYSATFATWGLSIGGVAFYSTPTFNDSGGTFAFQFDQGACVNLPATIVLTAGTCP